MVAAPSLNPVVIYATMTAFNSWQIAMARWTAGLMAVIGVGMIVTFFGHRAFNKLVPVDELVCHSVSRQRVSKKNQWLQAMSHDALSSLTFVIIGAGCAAIATTLLPRSFMSVVQNNILMAILVMMGLAMMLSLCSLGDAFVAASFSALPLASLLVFLVLGPIIDLKLAALMDGMLGVQATKVIALAGVCMALISTIIVAGIWGWLS
jgi:putative permease